MNLLHVVLSYIHKIIRLTAQIICKHSFSKCGKNVVFDPLNSNFSYKNIELGDQVFIGGRAWFSCSHGKIRIGSHIMFGPDVKILGGNHKFRNIGRLMYHDNEKNQGDDKGVIIEDDTWIGANVVILEGVTIRQGTVVAAGSVVTTSTLAYSIFAGIPARCVAKRFNDEQLAEHLNILRSEEA